MKSSPYLFFNGDCEQAFKFYERALGAKIEATMTYDGTPGAKDVPPNFRNKIIHGSLRLGDTVIMASDAPPNQYHKPEGFSVLVDAKSPEEAERYFSALSEGGKVSMPIAETFWAKRYGMLTDRFGIPWMVNCSKEQQQTGGKEKVA